jgi:hypothetical protein
MTERDRHGLRGSVKAVITETFEWDEKAGAISEKPCQREELTFSPQGNLLENVSQFQDGPKQRATNFYDEDGRLREIRFHNADGTESSLPMKYDPHGQPIRFGATVTYSSENGHKVKTEVLEAKTTGVDRALGFEDSPSQASFWSTGDAAVASTFYDGAGRPCARTDTPERLAVRPAPSQLRETFSEICPRTTGDGIGFPN